ncbi:baseplate assembly protein, partial [Cereibacter changlensis JA139]
TGSGGASPALIATVAAALNDEDVRPLCDEVIVQGATILPYSVTASLRCFSGPDTSAVLAAAETAVRNYVADSRRLGRALRRSGLFAALHQPGVEQVTLTEPAADIEPTTGEATWCAAISLSQAP